MVNINGNNYITVAERLKSLHMKYDKVSIESEVLRFDHEYVLVKTKLTIDQNIFVAHAQEKIDPQLTDHTSMLMKTETKSLGRALAFAGFGVSESIASAEEMVDFEKVSKPQGATENQINSLKDLLTDMNVLAPERARIRELLQNQNSTKGEASKLLGYFLGNSQYVDGSWQKKDEGILSQRRVNGG